MALLFGCCLVDCDGGCVGVCAGVYGVVCVVVCVVVLGGDEADTVLWLVGSGFGSASRLLVCGSGDVGGMVGVVFAMLVDVWVIRWLGVCNATVAST